MSNEQVSAGFYKGRAIGGSEQYGTTSAGNSQIVLDVDVPSLGRQFSVFLNFSDAAAPYAIEKLRACGWEGDDVTSLVGIETNEIDIAIKYETYDGKTRMKVDISTASGRFKLDNPMSEIEKRSFASRMRPFVKGGEALAGRKLAPRQTAEAPRQAVRREGAYDPGPPQNDDLPF